MPSITSSRVRIVRPKLHQFGDAAPITDAFEHLRRDQRDGFRVIQLHPRALRSRATIAAT